MENSGRRTSWRDVACPHCGLACDDLEIEVVDGCLIPLRGACAISTAAFERAAPGTPAPRLAGAPAARDAAIAAAAGILGQSRLPLIGGLGADVDGIRGALALADHVGGVVDHLGSDGLFRDLVALRDIGTITATYSEIRNRADLMLVIGPDPLPLMPRLLDRCFSGGLTLFAEAAPVRRLIRLGPESAPPQLPAGVEHRLAPCPANELAPMVARLRARVKGRKDALAGSEILGEIAGALRAARYPIIAWSAALLPSESADLIILSLTEILRDLSRAGRAAALPLGGADNLTGANQACLWQTGYPLRTGFGAGAPQHDPHLFAARRLIDSGEADVLVWISAISGAPPPPLPPEMSLILLASTDDAPAGEAAVFLPVGRPSIDHPGQIFRGDGVVALPLPALRPSSLTSVGATLRDIVGALGAPIP
jgi:formylmethanofuran dehydrogenase subunit B